jgi:hypothetical protein
LYADANAAYILILEQMLQVSTSMRQVLLRLVEAVRVPGQLQSDGSVSLANNGTIVGTSGSTGEIKRIAGAPFFYDGSAWREFVLSTGTPVAVPADTEWDND